MSQLGKSGQFDPIYPPILGKSDGRRRQRVGHVGTSYTVPLLSLSYLTFEILLTDPSGQLHDWKTMENVPCRAELQHMPWTMLRCPCLGSESFHDSFHVSADFCPGL